MRRLKAEAPANNGMHGRPATKSLMIVECGAGDAGRRGLRCKS